MKTLSISAALFAAALAVACSSSETPNPVPSTGTPVMRSSSTESHEGSAFGFVECRRHAPPAPHMRSDLQVQKGLHGVIRVRAANEPAVDHEHVLMLDDVRLKPDGTPARPRASADAVEAAGPRAHHRRRERPCGHGSRRCASSEFHA